MAAGKGRRGGLVALAWRWQEMEKVVQDACSYSKKMFVAPLPFSFIPYQAVPKTRSGQKVPWALGGNWPHFLNSIY